MGGEKKAYGTYGEGGTGKGEIIWNVNKEYRKEKRKKGTEYHGTYVRGGWAWKGVCSQTFTSCIIISFPHLHLLLVFRNLCRRPE